MSNVHKFQPRKPAPKPGRHPSGDGGRPGPGQPKGGNSGGPDGARRSALAVMIGIAVLVGLSMLIGGAGP